MNTNTLFLAWQDKKEESRQWFPIGRLDAELFGYRFCYLHGAERAADEAGFAALIEFPDLYRPYTSQELFPLFQNRVITRARPDFTDYLDRLDLPEGANPFEILSVNGGSRITDSYEVFPKLVKDENGWFTCRFFLHGWRHVNAYAQDRIAMLKPKDPLYVTLELGNPATGLAVQIQTQDYFMIGWTPRYLVADLAAAMTDSPQYSAHVVRINPLPAPSRQRVLIEMRGRWSEHRPMESEDFVPLVD